MALSFMLAVESSSLAAESWISRSFSTSKPLEWGMGNGKWECEMGNGKWEWEWKMGNGKWKMEMGNGKWEMGCGNRIDMEVVYNGVALCPGHMGGGKRQWIPGHCSPPMRGLGTRLGWALRFEVGGVLRSWLTSPPRPSAP